MQLICKIGGIEVKTQKDDFQQFISKLYRITHYGSMSEATRDEIEEFLIKQMNYIEKLEKENKKLKKVVK